MIRRVYQHPEMPHQKYLANPHRPEGATADGILGDCWRTALAGALGRDRDDVPHFVNMSDRTGFWWFETNRWLQEEYGALIYCCDPDRWHSMLAKDPDHPDTFYPGGRPFVVVSGPSPRGAFSHACVADRNLDVIHDPHPLGVGLERVEMAYVVRLDVWRMAPRRALTAAA